MGALEDLMMNAREISPQRDIMRMVAPNYTSVLEGNPNPRQFPMNAPPGKIPSMDDPRMGGSVLEALMLASSMSPAGRMAGGANAASRMIPEIMQSAPGLAPMVGKTAAGGATLASILGGTGGDNAEAGDFNWTDPNKGRTERLKYLDKEIEKESTRRTPSAPGTQKARIDALSKEKEQLTGQQSQEYNTALEQFNKAGEDERAAAERKRQEEAPFRQRYPNAYQTLPLGGWGTAGLAGLAAGAKWPGLKSQISSGIGGALESAAFSAGPTAYDSETLPYGSKYQQEAEGLLHNPNYWAGRVGPAAGLGAAAGFTGAKWGTLARKPAAAMPQPSQPSGGAPTSNMNGSTQEGLVLKGQQPSTTASPQASIETSSSPRQSLTREYNNTVNELQDLLPLGPHSSVKARAMADKLRARLDDMDTQINALEKGNVQHMPGSMTPEIRQAMDEVRRNATFNSIPLQSADTVGKSAPRVLIQRTDKLGRDYWFDQATGNRAKKMSPLEDLMKGE